MNFPLPNAQHSLIFLLLNYTIISVSTCVGAGDINQANSTEPVFPPGDFIPISIHFRNADPRTKPDEDNHPQRVNVLINAPNGQLLTVKGKAIDEQAIESTEVGIVNLKLPKVVIQNAPASTYYTFTIHAEAPGYLDAVKTIIINNTDPKYEPVFMVDSSSVADLPGISLTRDGFTILQNGMVVGEDSNIEAVSNNESNDPLIGTQISIPAETFLLTEDLTDTVDGTQGMAKYQLDLFDIRNDVSLNAFPSNSFMTNAVDSLGEIVATPTNPKFLKTFGYFNLDINVGDQEVGGFDQPVEVTFTVYDNEEKLGLDGKESLSLWRLEEISGQWVEVSRTSIKQIEPLIYELTFFIDHLSDHVIGEEEDPCLTMVNINNPGNFKTRYIRATYEGGTPLLPNGNVVNLIAENTLAVELVVPDGEPFDFEIFRTCNYNIDNLDQSDEFAPCNSTQSISVQDPQDAIGCELLEIQIACPENGTCFVLDAVGFNFSTGFAIYEYIGSLLNGRILFDPNKISDNTTLNFLLWFDDASNTIYCNNVNGSVCFSGQVCLSCNELFPNVSATGAAVFPCRTPINDENVSCSFKTTMKIVLEVDCQDIFGTSTPGNALPQCMPDNCPN